MKLSNIIISWNNKWVLEYCVKSILENTSDKDNVECIIVDNGSQDGSQEFLREVGEEKPIKLMLLDKNYGPYVALNKGIEQSTGEFIGNYHSDDMVFPREWDKYTLARLNPKEWIVARLLNAKLSRTILQPWEAIYEQDIGRNVVDIYDGCGNHPETFDYNEFLRRADKWRNDTRFERVVREYGNPAYIHSDIIKSKRYPEGDFWAGNTWKLNKARPEQIHKEIAEARGIKYVCYRDVLLYHFWHTNSRWFSNREMELQEHQYIVPEGFDSIEQWYRKICFNEDANELRHSFEDIKVW